MGSLPQQWVEFGVNSILNLAWKFKNRLNFCRSLIAVCHLICSFYDRHIARTMVPCDPCFVQPSSQNEIWTISKHLIKHFHFGHEKAKTENLNSVFNKLWNLVWDVFQRKRPSFQYCIVLSAIQYFNCCILFYHSMM
jgi:hypothetical protein